MINNYRKFEKNNSLLLGGEMEKIIWVGNKLSDISEIAPFFYKTINLYGKSGQKNICFKNIRCNNNIENPQLDCFIQDTLMHEIAYSDAKIMFYNPRKAFKFGKKIQNRSICLNDIFLLELLNDKITCHDFLVSEINFAPYITAYGQNINYQQLRKIFPMFEKFIIQKSKGSGGFETYILTQKNSNNFWERINPNNRYLLSGYIEHNVSYNIHIIIGDEDYIIFPPSKQIIEISSERLIYRGADFINVNKNIIPQMFTEMLPVINKLKELGYRGVLGADLIHDLKADAFYLAELNCRFQGSSYLLNKALLHQKLPSLQELNIIAFRNGRLNTLIPTSIEVPYGCVMYYQNVDSPINIENSYLLSREDDDLLNYSLVEPYAYLFKEIYGKELNNEC